MADFARGPWGAAYPLHLQGVIAGETIGPLRHDILQVIALPPHDRRQQSSKSFHFMAVGGARVPVCHRTLERLILAFRRSPMYELAQAVLGPDIAFLVESCSVRHQSIDHPEQALDIHFDASFIGCDHPALNFWVTLDDAGDEAPSLSFVNDPALRGEAWQLLCEHVLDRAGAPLDPNPFGHTLRRRFGDRLARSLQPRRVLAGDCLLFDTATLHATQHGTGFTKERVSVEYRLCAVDRVPEKVRKARRHLAVVAETEQGLSFSLRPA